MTVNIPTELAAAAGKTEREVLIDMACRLYDGGKMDMWPAARSVGLTRDEFQQELHNRGLPIFRYTEEHLRQDLDALRKMAG